MSQSLKKKGSGRIWLIIFGLFIILIGIGIYRASSPNVSVKNETVLLLKLEGSLPELVLSEGFPGFSPKAPSTLQGTLEILEKATYDERIKLIVLSIDALSTSQSKLMEIREAIAAYRSSGKEIWAFMSQFSGDAEYLLASACNKIFFERYGVLVLDGLRAELLYFKTTLGKIGVQYEVARRGKYKSAGESFTNDSISIANLEQIDALLTDFDNTYVKSVSSSRHVDEATYRRIINEQAYISDKSALAQGLVDSICYFGELKALIRQNFNVSEDDESIFMAASKYQKVSFKSLNKSSSNKIAVINILGGLVDGKSNSSSGESNSGDETIVPVIEEARKDKSVKSIILRVDSPGGSAIASDKILMALNKAKLEKPVVVSMSGVAASGGYWVSMQASKIVANPTTITGSIGVIALKPSIRELADKIGLKRTVVSKAKYADAFNLFDKLSPEVYKIVDDLIDYTYKEFIAKVSEGRKLSIASVESIAQGHVWSGSRAKDIGLVDELGGFNKALNLAKSLANIDSSEFVQLVSYPKSVDFFESIFGEFGDASLGSLLVKSVWLSLKNEAKEDLMGVIGVPTELSHSLNLFTRLSVYAPLQPQVLMPIDIIVK